MARTKSEEYYFNMIQNISPDVFPKTPKRSRLVSRSQMIKAMFEKEGGM